MGYVAPSEKTALSDIALGVGQLLRGIAPILTTREVPL
jgi:hypothetical protein